MRCRLLMSSLCENALKNCSRFALRNAALISQAEHASRRPEIGDCSFALRRASG
jgi:hypothetical protein